MTNASTAGFNGKAPRKTLADQLDRLDAIIDALAAGLNETVADRGPAGGHGGGAADPGGAGAGRPEQPRPAAPADRAARPARRSRSAGGARGRAVPPGPGPSRPGPGVVLAEGPQGVGAAGLAAGLLALAAGPAVAAVLSGAGGVAAALLVMGGIAVRRMARAAPPVPA